MLVVSNIDLPADLPIIKPETFLHSSFKDFIVNVNNDYRYLKTGYYVSLHAEILGNLVIPSSENIIDAYRTPILLLRASKAGVPTLPYIVTGSVRQIIEEIGFPTIIFAVNPFSYEGYKIANNRSALYRAVKSLSMHYRFAVCAQPLEGEIVSVNSVFGKYKANPEIEKVARKIYEVFKLPLCKLHLQLVDGKPYLCGLQPVRKEEIDLWDAETFTKELYEILEKNGGQFFE